jgi:Tol biopolymer transport system component
MYEKLSNGAGGEELLAGEESADLFPLSWSFDGRFLLYAKTQVIGVGGLRDLWVLPMNGDRKPFPLVQTQFDDRIGQFSPDGRWVAYSSNESGRYEVYVIPFPQPSGKWQVSSAGGGDAR